MVCESTRSRCLAQRFMYLDVTLNQMHLEFSYSWCNQLASKPWAKILPSIPVQFSSTAKHCCSQTTNGWEEKWITDGYKKAFIKSRAWERRASWASAVWKLGQFRWFHNVTFLQCISATAKTWAKPPTWAIETKGLQGLWMGFGWRYTLYIIIKPGTSGFSITVQHSDRATQLALSDHIWLVNAHLQLWSYLISQCTSTTIWTLKAQTYSTKQVSPPARGWYGDTYISMPSQQVLNYLIVILSHFSPEALRSESLPQQTCPRWVQVGKWSHVRQQVAKRVSLWCEAVFVMYTAKRILMPRGWLTFVNGECSMVNVQWMGTQSSDSCDTDIIWYYSAFWGWKSKRNWTWYFSIQ